MSAADLKVFPIDVSKMDLKGWHYEKAQKFRKEFLQARQKKASSGVVTAKL
jgi:hypothetical protein